jgi:selenocysteine lyase/cysteine desulfurase
MQPGSDRNGFGDLGGRVWLNASHQGPLPLAAAEEAREAVAWKTAPHELTTERFQGVPRRLRTAIGHLTGIPADDVILTNGSSYGVHLLANGIPLEAGDDVLLMKGDFPSNVLPWLAHRERGVEVRLLEPAGFVLEPDEVATALRARTRVLCMSWVHSFSGHVADLAAIGELCRERGVAFVVNTTQGLGACALDLSALPVDAVVNSGWKWLCGPYATGFCWMRPELRKRLSINRAYWLSMQTADDLAREEDEPRVRQDLDARRYDIFGTANFFNFKPWAAAIEHLLAIGIDRIEAHDRRLVARLIDGLDRERYRLISPESPGRRSTLVFVSHRERERNRVVYRRLQETGIHAAHRREMLRFSPHLYNTDADIDRALAVLAEA